MRILGDGEASFAIERLDLVEGTYKLDVAVHKLDGYPYDYHRLLYTFRVKSAHQGRRDLPAAATTGVFLDASSSPAIRPGPGTSADAARN